MTGGVARVDADTGRCRPSPTAAWANECGNADAAAKGPRVKPPKSGENALAWAMYADNPACLKGVISLSADVVEAAEAEVKASSADRSALCPPSDEGDSSCVP